jgi:hypothetical protein
MLTLSGARLDLSNLRGIKRGVIGLILRKSLNGHFAKREMDGLRLIDPQLFRETLGGFACYASGAVGVPIAERDLIGGSPIAHLDLFFYKDIYKISVRRGFVNSEESTIRLRKQSLGFAMKNTNREIDYDSVGGRIVTRPNVTAWGSP